MNTKQLNFSKNKTVLFLVAILFTSTTLFIGCEEEISPLGSEIMPDGDKIEVYYDSSLTFISQVLQKDTFNTTNLNTYYIGEIDDPNFGKLNVNYAGQFVHRVALDTLYQEYAIDSMVLNIAIDSLFYGTPNDLEFEIYKLNTNIIDSVFTHVSPISDLYDPLDKLSTSFEISGDSLLTFIIDSNFALELLSDTIFYETRADFMEYFNGFAIIATNNSVGGFIQAKFNDPESKATIYYSHNDKDSLQFEYSLAAGKRFTEHTQDFTGSLVNEQLINPDNDNDNLLFIQGLSNVKSKISFDNIDGFIHEDTVYSVLNANLRIPIFTNEYDNYGFPIQLFLKYYNEDGNLVIIDDYAGSLYDGAYNEDNDYYSFDISRHIKQILNQNIESKSIIIEANSQTILPNRAILKGDEVSLKITYTKHKQ